MGDHIAAINDVNGQRSLYIGNIPKEVNEILLYEIFSVLAPIESCKIIADKVSNVSSGYGFVDCYDSATAQFVMQKMNGRKIYDQELRVNWASAGGQKEDTSTHHHVFVGDLSPEIDDTALFNAFAPFGSISEGRVMRDPNTGRSRGYGFVAFRLKEHAEKAMNEMNGEWLGRKAVRCNWANQKTKATTELADVGTVAQMTPSSNATVYVGNLEQGVSEPHLRTIFQEFGHIDEIKMQTEKGFAFVRFATHDAAAKAIFAINQHYIGSKQVKCSWGKDTAFNPGAMQPVQPVMPRMGPGPGAGNFGGYGGYPPGPQGPYGGHGGHGGHGGGGYQQHHGGGGGYQQHHRGGGGGYGGGYGGY